MNPARRSKTAPSRRRGRRASLGRPAAPRVVEHAPPQGAFSEVREAGAPWSPIAGGGGRAAPAVPWPAVPPR